VKQKKRGRRRRAEDQLPGLRPILERARLEILSLIRALDRLGLFQDRPPILNELAELDADLAEALWVLDQEHPKFDLGAMVRDLRVSLEEIPKVCERLLGELSESLRDRVLVVASTILNSLPEREAYNDIPGRDPNAPRVR
jgi:hypothetical protein